MVLTTSLYYRVRPLHLPYLMVKQVAAPLLSCLYQRDSVVVARRCAQYVHGVREVRAAESWHSNGEITVRRVAASGASPPDVPFVYESPDAEYLREVVLRYHLEKVVSRQRGEYQQMLAVFRWIGTRWDHGEDKVPGGGYGRPAEIIAAGEGGARFWCDVCARVTVQVATALGWPARLVTGSSNGYTWEHAVAEIWSNQFGKWFVVDTDYNLVYEAKGVPLSAWELCHDAPELQKRGLLALRRLAPLKQGLSHEDLLYLYRYVHIDLRNDWYSRRLHCGSPAGGDLATWWTARPGLQPLLTAKVRVDSKNLFDWPVNNTEIFASGMETEGGRWVLDVALRGYSPYFSHFLARIDGSAWQEAPQGRWRLLVPAGRHTVEARIVTGNGGLGPVARAEFLMQ